MKHQGVQEAIRLKCVGKAKKNMGQRRYFLLPLVGVQEFIREFLRRSLPCARSALFGEMSASSFGIILSALDNYAQPTTYS